MEGENGEIGVQVEVMALVQEGNELRFSKRGRKTGSKNSDKNKKNLIVHKQKKLSKV